MIKKMLKRLMNTRKDELDYIFKGDKLNISEIKYIDVVHEGSITVSEFMHDTKFFDNNAEIHIADNDGNEYEIKFIAIKNNKIILSNKEVK